MRDFLSNTDPLLSLAMDAGWTVEEDGYYGYRSNLALRSTEVSAIYIELKITKYQGDVMNMYENVHMICICKSTPEKGDRQTDRDRCDRHTDSGDKQTDGLSACLRVSRDGNRCDRQR